jgi:tRNA/tmRNA/rRNA uracil-C5-methylase (TrmA/RlmC/RlmD family)
MTSRTPIQLSITDVAFGGKGVARHEGKVYFVPFTIPGEVVSVRVVRQKKNFAETELLSVEEPSADRVAPRCPYFGRCGGCSYQHISYERQLQLKAAQVEQTLRRVGRPDHVPMRTAIGAPEPYEYRNRIRVHRAGGVTGFFAHDAYSLVDVERCVIAKPEVNRALRRLRGAPVRDGDYSLRAPGGGGPFFEQTNEAVAREMVALVERMVLRGQKLLVDAYCGSGLFARHLAPLFEKAIGIEANSFAIENARQAASARENYIHGEVETHLGEILAAHDPIRSTIILDPPAVGISSRVSDLLIASRPAEIIYVSCNPGTLARDLAALCHTFRLEAVTPLDMFPQTAEIEVVASLRA